MTRTVLVLEGGVVVSGVWVAYDEPVAAVAFEQAGLDYMHAIVLTNVQIQGPHDKTIHTGHMIIKKSAVLAISVSEHSNLVTEEMLLEAMPGIGPGRP